MKRTKTAVFLSAFLIAILMGSCDALFENQFKALGLGQPSEDEIAEQAASSDPVVAQAALAIQVGTQLEDSGAAPLVDNFVNVLIDQGSNLENLTTSSDNINSVLAQLVSEELLSDPEALEAAIQGIIDSQAQLDALADTVDGDSFAASGLDTQQLAITAALGTIFSDLEVSATNTSGATSVAAAIADFVAAGAGADVADYLALAAGADIQADLTAPGSTTATLLLVAGIDVADINEWMS